MRSPSSASQGEITPAGVLLLACFATIRAGRAALRYGLMERAARVRADSDLHDEPESIDIVVAPAQFAAGGQMTINLPWSAIGLPLGTALIDALGIPAGTILCAMAPGPLELVEGSELLAQLSTSKVPDGVTFPLNLQGTQTIAAIAHDKDGDQLDPALLFDDMLPNGANPDLAWTAADPTISEADGRSAVPYR